jgi:hypothetical protein
VEEPKGQIIDLMQALKASLSQEGGEAARRGPRRSPRSTEADEPVRAAAAGAERSTRGPAAAARRTRSKK